MKLYWSPASPYVRKVLASAIARRIDTEIEAVACDVHAQPADLLHDNPLAKIPCLIAPDGTAVFDSPVICEYLDTLGSAPPLFPPQGSPERLRAQIRHALADGILDAAVARRMQIALPQDEGRKAFDAKQKAAIGRALARLESDPPRGLGDIGAIAVACALGYLDFRFAHEPWREVYPRLAAWFAEVSQLPPLARTAPKAP
jgi:glutathione S-transferase